MNLARRWAFYPLLKVCRISLTTYSLKIEKRMIEMQGLGAPFVRRVFQPRGRPAWCSLQGTHEDMLALRRCPPPAGFRALCMCSFSWAQLQTLRRDFPAFTCKPKQLRRRWIWGWKPAWPSCALRSVEINHVLFLITASLMQLWWKQCIIFYEKSNFKWCPHQPWEY